ncbi:MAG TPA: hypothetical protein VNI61_06680 [Gemmatimonadales bacterium]|nr:hypothetical protein [Gemmatimonadales bacterium]
MLELLTAWLLAAGLWVPRPGPDRPSGAGPYPACELLSLAEVAGVMGAPRAFIDSLNSGPNEMTGAQLCSWYVKEGSSEGVMLKLFRGATQDQAMTLWYGVRADGDWQMSKVEPVPIAGVGDEALYRPYPVGPGGSLIARKGLHVFLLTGSPSRDGLAALGKRVAGRLR